MGNIERAVRALIDNPQNVCNDMEMLEKLEKSAKEFQGFVEKGIIKSRGYNLQTIEDRTCTSRIFEFNSPQ